MAKHSGRVVWRETMTKDLAKAQAFYAGLFGWRFEDMPMPSGMYPIIYAGSKSIGGMMQLTPEMPMPPHWLSYVSVEDADAACAAATANGGQVAFGPIDVPNAGRLATVIAPDGAALAVLTPAGPDEAPGRPAVSEFCWETLSTANLDAAKAFWTKVVPTWRASTGAGGMSTFGVSEGMEGQIADLQRTPSGVPSHWLTYVVVEKLEASCDKATALGGRILMPALAIPGIGRIAVFADDQGAVLGLFEPAFG